jgi:folate-dependent phosphoribosylglycinamide formyltransferase PurN
MLIPEQQENDLEPLNVVVFGSGSGTNLQALIRDQKKWKSPPYLLRAAFSDRPCKFQEIATEANITPLQLSFAEFFKEQGCQDHRNEPMRKLFEENVIQMLDQLPYTIDMVILAGYMKLLYEPLLSRFKDKIINVHPADLTALDESGKRRYRGANSVFDALTYGESRTRSTVHLVNERADEGTILVSGPWASYTGGYPVTQESANAHQNIQKKISDWPALIEAVELISQRRLTMKEGQIYLDDIAMPRGGVIM